MVKESISVRLSKEDHDKIIIKKLPDLSDESDNSLDWGFYMYSNIVDIIGQAHFTIYYSDGYEIITSWFPKFLLRNFVSTSLMARNKVEDGVSATEVRQCIIDDLHELSNKVPKCVYQMKDVLKAYIEVQ